MLDLKYIRENLESVKAGVSAKKVSIDFDTIIKLDDERRKTLIEVEQLKAERNKANELIGAKKAKKEDASSEIASISTISQKIKELDREMGDIQSKLTEITLNIPNIPDNDVPEGDEKANELVKSWGNPR